MECKDTKVLLGWFRAACISLCWIMLVAVGVGEVHAQDGHDGLSRDIQSILDEWVSKFQQPGATAAYVLPSGEVHGFASGWADAELGHKMIPAHRMHAGSYPKSYTAAVALSMHHERKLDLDAPISRYVGTEPWFRFVPNGSEISLRSLLDMTAGIGGALYAPALLEGQWSTYLPRERGGYAELLRTTVGSLTPIENVPAGSHTYTDAQYILAGVVIEAASGEKIEEAVHRRFTYPFELVQTEPADRKVVAGLAKGYVDESTRRRGVAAWEGQAVSTDGVLNINLSYSFTSGHYISNSRDLARWMWLFNSGRAMQWPYMNERTLRPGSDGSSEEVSRFGFVDAGYGLGMHAYTHPTLGSLHCHDGGMPGYSTVACYLPDFKIAIAAQTNRRYSGVPGEPAHEIRFRLADRVAKHVSKAR